MHSRPVKHLFLVKATARPRRCWLQVLGLLIVLTSNCTLLAQGFLAPSVPAHNPVVPVGDETATYATLQPSLPYTFEEDAIASVVEEQPQFFAPAPVQFPDETDSAQELPLTQQAKPALTNSNLQIRYDRGVLLANNDSSDRPVPFPFSVRTNAWLQLRHAVFETDGPNRDRSLFSFERLRLTFNGEVYSPDLTYTIAFDGNTDQSVEVSLLDCFLNYDIGHNRYDFESKKFVLRGGKWKVPFSRSRFESARRLQFSERSATNLFFDIGRAIGVGTFSESNDSAIPFYFETAIFNGFNTGRDSTIPSEDLDNNYGWSARTYADLFNDFGQGGESDLEYRSAPTLRVGTGIATTRVSAEGQSEFARQRVVDSGARLADILPPGVSSYDIALMTVDTHWKYRGFSLIAEYHWRRTSQFVGNDVPDLLDRGALLQTGYFVVPKKLELVFRWADIVGDSGTLGARDESTEEIAGGFGWYIRGNDIKLNLDASRISGTPLNSARLNLLPGDDGWLMRTQLQCGF